ncbi:hydroxymethylglutaryl-CoA lyase [Mesoterricola sediminis]|uniref:Hydroxymethylglutaryl-CoA lyase n=1 Tax=Mesoterricola sediminis TaxID=2927980 RepID=A0AA48H3D6_9BACT|nr:hydroxymethylglutaryl-CoA lyase [Mesoterricola sediminis]BDU75268.1 hydroxymethylglutaryl-CoA lyase [Mesoterricola sediminis]
MAGIVLHEVGPRDGLQVERQVVPTEVKERWIRALLASGLDIVQVGSFVHPEKVPQMADTDELFRRLSLAPGPRAVLSGLVLNEKGLERGMACGVELFCMGVSASDTHSRKNTGMGSLEAQQRILAMGRAAQEAGKKVQVSVQSAFGCGFEGRIDRTRVLDIVRAYLDAGLTSISLADTAGHAHPDQVKDLFGAILALGPVQATAHFHDTYGLGMANVYAAMGQGVTTFETSFAGLGGCPFTKVAAGNVATEDLVHGLRRVGLRTDVDLPALIDIAKDVAAFFGRDMTGRVHRAGPLGY